MSYRYPDHVERLLAVAKVPSQYGFDQIVAEAAARIGQPLVETYLTAAARFRLADPAASTPACRL